MSHSSALRPLILTVACGYMPDQLAPFVKSWKKHLPAADLVVIAGDLPEETNRFLEAEGTKIVPVEFNLRQLVWWRKAWYRMHLTSWLRMLCFSRRLLGIGYEADALYSRIAEAAFHLFSQRFFHYRRYLRHFSWKYSHVLLVDSRTLFFKAHPSPAKDCTSFQKTNQSVQASLPVVGSGSLTAWRLFDGWAPDRYCARASHSAMSLRCATTGNQLRRIAQSRHRKRCRSGCA